MDFEIKRKVNIEVIGQVSFDLSAVNGLMCLSVRMFAYLHFICIATL